VHRNLLEDRNVSDEHRQALCAHVESRPETTSPDEAGGLYADALSQLEKQGYTFSSSANQKNRIAGMPFGRFGRVVPLVSFMKYNVFGTGRVTRRVHATGIGPKLARARLGALRPGVDRLRANVSGARCTFATSADAFGAEPEKADADDVRDRLGLDDQERFPAGSHLVLLAYDASKIPAGACYRPTVLDPGWCPVAAAFRPHLSAHLSAAPEPGYTQHLKTGERSQREVIHEGFPANQIAAYSAVGPLKTDPPTDYRDKRLASPGP